MVGRRSELEQLTGALERAGDGAASLVVVGGSAGVGKTRLVRAFADGADARVLVGGCVDLGDGALPYAPLVEALRSLRAELGADRLRMLAGKDARELARLLPGLPRDAGASDAPVDRGVFYEAVLGLVHRLAAERTLVLALEDLHWADRSTLDLVAFLARNLHDHPVLLLVTFRSDDLHRTHPLRAWLGELTRLPAAERLDLEPFTREELTEQLAAILDSPPEHRLVDAVLDRSEGNPFYAEELLAADQGAGGTVLPPSLHDLLAARLLAVSDAARPVLRVAAAAGRQVDHALLARVANLPEMALLDGLREAVASQVLEAGDGGAAYRFRHALLQEVAYGELLPGERATLHARIAAVLVEHPDLAAGGADFVHGQLAHHWSVARDLPQAFVASLAAAAAAEQQYAFAEALTHLERALELWEQVPAELRADRARHDVLRSASATAMHAAEQRRSMEYARAALAQAEQDGAESTVVASLLRHLSYLSWVQGDVAEGLRILDRAVATAGDEPTLELAQVLGWRSRLLAVSGRGEEAFAPGEQAVTMARALGATREEGYAHNSLAVARAVLGDTDGAVEQLAEARRLALEAGALEDVGVSYLNEVYVLGSAGRPAASVEVAAQGEAWAVANGLRVDGLSWMRSRVNAVESLTELGRYEEAEAWLAATPFLHEDPFGQHGHRMASARLHLVRGELALARAHAEEAAAAVRGQSDAQAVVSSAVVLATLDRVEGRPEAGLARLDAALADDEAWSVDCRPQDALLVYGACACQVALAAGDRGDEASVEDVLGRLDAVIGRAEAMADTEPQEHTRRSLEQAVLQARAERTWLRGEPDVGAWEAAVEAFPTGAPVGQVLDARTRMAEALVACGDTAAAAEVVGTTRESAVAAGAWQVERDLDALARRARLQVDAAVRSEAGVDHFGLTAREQEVLRLVAEGHTNRHIGETLYIAEKTASVHVSNILAKLGVGNRGEAAAVAHRAGLTQQTPS